MYYHVTGIHSPRFLVNIFVHSVLYKYYNLQEDVHGWDDKNIYERLNKKVKFPTSLAHRINGRFYDSDYNVYDNTDEGLAALSERIFEALRGDTSMIVKESKDSSAGKGVKLIKDISRAEDVKHLLRTNDSENYIIQKKLVQHPFFDQFCSSSVNIVRIMSWRDKNEVKLFPATIRYGVEGTETDISYKDGKEIANVVGVNEDGTINDKFMSFDGEAKTHPTITDKQIPNWQILKRAVEAAHQEMFHFDFIGWDFTIDENGEPICIEYNIYSPGTILYQYANGPLAGKYTEEFLAILKERQDLIPRMFRYKKA